jgi:hypothetical protein
MQKVFDKFCTLDCEGDARSARINQAMFPKGCHFDPDTRVWCVTTCLYDEECDCIREYIFVCKLPDKPREYPKDKNGNYPWIAGKVYEDTGIYHNVNSKVYKKEIEAGLSVEIDNEEVNYDSVYLGQIGKRVLRFVEVYDNVYEYFFHIRAHLNMVSKDYKIYVKPYIDKDGKRYNYDKLALGTQFNRYFHTNVITDDNDTQNLLNQIQTWNPKEWVGSKQAQDFNNERWMAKAIKHNMDDTEELLYRIWEQTQICRKIYKAVEKEEAIKGDF